MRVPKLSLITCLAVILVLAMASVSQAQECVATGDVNCSGGDITIEDLSELLIHLSITFTSLPCSYEADVKVDGIIDWRDVQVLTYLLLSTVEPGAPPTTVCEPLLIYWDDTTIPLGASTVTSEESYVTVDGIGTSGEDGVRIYPNMGGGWQNAVEFMLVNFDLTAHGNRARFNFTGAGGMALQDPFPLDIDSGIYVDYVAVADFANTGGMAELTVDFLSEDISEIEITPFVNGIAVGSYVIDANIATLTSDLLSTELIVTEFSLALGESTELRFQLSTAIEFSIDSESPPIVFSADEITFAAVNLIQPTVGVGPLDITAANIGWFNVNSPSSCCVSHPGDANGNGADEPTIGDVSAIIDAKFITGSCAGILACLAEADVNLSGGCNPTCSDITIGDISMLIDYLFISGLDPIGLPNCLDCL